MGLGAWGLGSRVWGLASGVWGLGVWGWKTVVARSLVEEGKVRVGLIHAPNL